MGQGEEVTANDDDEKDGCDTANVEVPTSKTQLKKRKRQEAWEAGREERKVKRRQKAKEKKVRLRVAKEASKSKDAGSNDEAVDVSAIVVDGSKSHRSVPVPFTLVIDCGFDELMIEKEINSLSSQITRCYSEIRRAQFRPQVAVTSFGGRLKDRFESVLRGDYTSWRDIHFLEDSYEKAVPLAKDWVSGVKIKSLPEPMKSSEENKSESGRVVYLTGDSPNVLDRIKPDDVYIVGGLVDRNRHKGICYKRAMDIGMETAKLPIADYLEMSSRTILATNHVVEIMLRWLELGDWGQAFLSVIPQRKGMKLKMPLCGQNGGEGEVERDGAAGSAGGGDGDGIDDAEPNA